jgi:hypothetical protein
MANYPDLDPSEEYLNGGRFDTGDETDTLAGELIQAVNSLPPGKRKLSGKPQYGRKPGHPGLVLIED